MFGNGVGLGLYACETREGLSLHITASLGAAISVIMLNIKLLASALDSGIQMCLMRPTGGGIR